MTENNSVKDRKSTGFGFGSFFKSNKDKDDASLGDYVTQTEYNEKINGMEERLKTQEKYVSRLLQINTKNLPFTRGGSKKTRKNKKLTKGKAKKTRRRS
jgi:hypothetical protein